MIRLKRVSLFGAMSVVMSSVLVWGAGQYVERGNKILDAPTSIDFGELDLTSIGQRSIIIKNMIDREIEVKCKTGCGCLKAVFDSEKIAPGKGAMLKLTYDPMKVGNFGPNSQNVVIIGTAGNTRRVYVINVTASVRRFYECSPTFVDYGNFLIGTACSKDILLRSTNPLRWAPNITSLELVDIKGASVERTFLGKEAGYDLKVTVGETFRKVSWRDM